MSLAQAVHGLPLRKDELNKLEQNMTAFWEYTGVPVTLLDTKGMPIWELGKNSKLCSLFDMYQNPDSPCRKALLSAAKISNQLGEPYVFVCRAGFVNIAMPVLVMGKVFGHFVAGPMVMGLMQESLLNNIFSLTEVQEEQLPRLMVFIRGMRDHTPRDIAHLSVMFGSGVLASIRQNADYARLTAWSQEQQRVGEHIRLRKKDHPEEGSKEVRDRTHHLEELLAERVREGDRTGTAQAVGEWVEERALTEAGDLSAVKIKVLSFCTILARQTGEDTFLNEMDEISQAGDLTELTELTTSFFDNLCSAMESSPYRGNSPIVRNALEIIHREYGSRLSLSELSETLHINPSYLSMLFKQETGQSFTDYINNLRIVRSRDLLSRTNLSLGEIASRTGFEDQSYFSKIFRKYNHVTPKEYRRNHLPANAAARLEKNGQISFDKPGKSI